MPDIPGWEGSVGPFPSQYGQSHVYARDVYSGSGNCVCARPLVHRLHVQAAPGVNVVPDDAETVDRVAEAIADSLVPSLHLDERRNAAHAAINAIGEAHAVPRS